MNSFKVRLHTNEKPGAEATDRTLKSCPMGGGYLLRDENQEIVFDEHGMATVCCDNPAFMKFALRQQGYVAEVI